MAAGAPTKYKAINATIAAAMCKLGATDQDLADEFKVYVRTISNWKSKHPKFLQALRVNKAVFDDRVEAALYQRAVGYSHMETKTFLFEGEIVTHEVLKHYPPETKAMSVWLYNRRGDKWHPRPEQPEDDSTIEPQKVIIEVVDARVKKD